MKTKKEKDKKLRPKNKKLRFADYKHCLEATQLEDEIN